MTIRALRPFRVAGIIQGISTDEVLDLADHVARGHIAAGDAVDALATVPVVEEIVNREPEVENRDPVATKRKKKV